MGTGDGNALKVGCVDGAFVVVGCGVGTSLLAHTAKSWIVKGCVASAPANLPTKAVATHDSPNLYWSSTEENSNVTQNPIVSKEVGTGVG